MNYTREEMAAARFESESADLSQTVPCDVCEGRGTRRTTNDPAFPCSRCKATGRRSIHADPMAAPHVDVTIPTALGSLRIASASGPLESIRLRPVDEDGDVMPYAHLTPSDARRVGALLIRYADTHKESDNAR